MGTELRQRRVDLVVESVRITGLRVVFDAKKSLAKEPNSLDLRIYNLSKQTRSSLQGRGLKVLLLAGYQNEIGQIFSGDSRTCDHVYEKPDWVTRIQCGDGEVKYRTSRFVESFAPGTQVADVLEACARALGVGIGNAKVRFQQALPRNFQQFVQGFAAHGNAAQYMDMLVRSAGLAWSIQDGELQVLSTTEVNTDEVVLLTPKTGLIGSPVHGSPDKKGGLSTLKVRSLLQHKLRPGGRFKLEADSIRGVFRVEKLGHNGDTASGPWYTALEAKPA